MRPRPPLPPGPFLVVGLARSGLAAALALRARGETVVAVDAGRPAADAVAALEGAGAEVHVGEEGAARLRGVRAVVKSPGVPPRAPVVRAALDAGLTVMGELELGWRLLPNAFVAVTGTNGKTTTVELLGHIHREAGLGVAVAGNVGTALSSLAGTVAPDATVVVETSSFQLHDTLDFASETAVLVNVSTDHLDWHGSFEAYRAAKLRIFAPQGNDDVAVAPSDLAVEDLGGCARRVCFGTRPGDELSDRAGQLWWDEEPLIAARDIRLPGPHNRRNAMAAAAAALARGIEADAVRTALRTFAGVAHRLELVAERDGVRYVNDSKATNVDSTLVALASYSGGVHLILGGRSKGGGYAALAGAVREKARSAYLIGEAADAIASDLASAGVPLVRAGDLEVAVAAARAAARPGEVVLLSPAATSWDQYPDFEARGEHFRALAVAGGRPVG